MHCRAEQGTKSYQEIRNSVVIHSHTEAFHQFCSVTKPTFWLGSLGRELWQERAPGQQCHCFIQLSMYQDKL